MSFKSKRPKVQSGVEWEGVEIRTLMPEEDLIVARVWIERGSMEVVGHTFGAPEALPPFSTTFLETTRNPAIGRPRIPKLVILEDPVLGEEIRKVVGPETEVRVGPTPMANRFREELIRRAEIAEAADDYLGGGQIQPQAMERLFRSAQVLFHVAPWKAVTDDQVIRVDVDDREIHGACMSIIGNLGQNRGFLLFPSYHAYLSFCDSADENPEEPEFDTEWLALDFVSEEEISPRQKEQVGQYGWSIAGPDAYPNASRYDEHGHQAIAEAGDVELLQRCASALSAFVIRNGTDVFSSTVEPTSQTFSDAGGKKVRLTYPAEAEDLFDLDEPSSPVRQEVRIGRNDPCPCGSGKKFKKCCLNRSESVPLAAPGDPASTHRLDMDLVARIIIHARSRFGTRYDTWLDDFHEASDVLQLAMPYAAYCFAIDGTRAVDDFLEQKGRNLQVRERAWLQAQSLTWLSVWEIQSVVPGIEVEVLDLLSGERRTVLEKSGSANAGKRDTLLARVTDFEAMSLFCGTHPRALPPQQADLVVESLRKHLRLKNNVPVDRLREYEINCRLVKSWEEAAADLDRKAKIPPVLKNTDGDPFLLTTDRFRFEPAAFAQIQSRLAAIDGVIDVDGAGTDFALERENPPGSPLPSTTTGTVCLLKDTLIAETNSVKRADALRVKLIQSCGELLKPALREHTDPRSPQNRRASGVKRDEPEIPEDIRLQILQEFKSQHYAAWPDQSIPALDGMTPRAASRDKKARHKLDVLLKEMERSEGRLPAAERADIGALRRELGFDA